MKIHRSNGATNDSLGKGKSLKTALREVERLTGFGADALYSCQRRLVDDGILPATPGRGPGSGTPATLETLTVLLVNFIAERPSFDIAAARTATRTTKPCQDVMSTNMMHGRDDDK